MPDLYSTELLALASALPPPIALREATGQGSCRSPTCGSRVETTVVMRDDRLVALSQDVRACLLGQASAAKVAQMAVGLDRGAVLALRDAVAAMLAGSPAPAGFDALAPARAVPARHASVLLPFEALLAAMEKSRHP
ncbi:iron-sulfur cluster assembly scaffold protein [Falsirhodobacter halotolerans]|uniref:iron-sulfur cluster assembly scaffold protein n=1 Tax=Falsirhodobacter halotolerans TaxID=1146892 RepID=UPI001FD10094|nr:iron-sulfur cluster assembly scaffold protein [Falsirhodobacter halotolerans]MCJ8139634.1 iron-sulfur cluster assembly scaffold protein [Falsirhodobacter halotolerans]